MNTETFKGQITAVNDRTFDAVMPIGGKNQFVEFNKLVFSKRAMESLPVGSAFIFKVGLNFKRNPKIRFQRCDSGV